MLETRIQADQPMALAIESLLSPPPRPRYSDGVDPFVHHVWDGRIDARKLDTILTDITEGRGVGAHIHGLLRPEECDAALQRAAAHRERNYYIGAKDVGHIGDALFETQFSPEAYAAYFDRALHNIGESRGLFGTGRNPMDLVRALVDEGSTKGASLLRIGDKVCPFGLVRFQEEGSEILTHTDEAGRDIPGSLETQQIESQISIVVFLSQADEGGETTVYPARLSALQYDANRLPAPSRYAIDEAILPRLSVTFRPKRGDAILFEARYPHRVSCTRGQPRYTVTGFIGTCRDGRRVLFS